MPTTNITRLPKSEIKIEFTVTPEEAKPYLDAAVTDISTAKPLPGFRPGKATYEDLKHATGEMRIWEAALEKAVRAFYIKTILHEGIDTVGSPSVSVDQLTPGQDIKFTVIAPLEPEVTAFPDFDKCRVKTKETHVTEKHVDDAIQEMRMIRRKEVRVDRGATMEDLVVIDLEMKKDKVTLEGGAARDHRVYLKEEHYIPGFTKELKGIKEGEERTFTLPFPQEHFQKHIAGQNVDFTAKVKGVFELQLPEADDEFAKGVGIDTLLALRQKLEENMGIEMKRKIDEAAEIEMLDKLVDGARLSEVPDILVNEEVRRMLSELERGVEAQGMKWPDYLASLKKTTDELKIDFVPQAARRIKTAVLIKQITKKENLKIEDSEVDKEIDRILGQLRPEDKETRERVSSPEYREYVAIQMRNRKALEWIKKRCVT